ncbi:MAG: hypothetical protein AAGA54_03170 [Myxococcota bacterium]
MAFRPTLLSSFVALCACTLAQDADAPFGADGPGDSTGMNEGSTGGSGTDAENPAFDPVQSVCERLDACGFLPPGIRRSDCEDTTLTCLDGALQSEVADWSLGVEACLAFENCFNMLDCYEGLQTCEIDVSGSTGAFGDASTTAAGLTTGPTETAADSEGEGGEAGSTGVDDPTDPTSADGDGGASDAGDDPSGDPPPPVCAGTCDACLDCAFTDPCLDFALDCVDNPECVALSDCYALCDGNASCFDDCDFFHPAGIADYAALATCSLDVCEASC